MLYNEEHSWLFHHKDTYPSLLCSPVRAAGSGRCTWWRVGMDWVSRSQAGEGPSALLTVSSWPMWRREEPHRGKWLSFARFWFAAVATVGAVLTLLNQHLMHMRASGSLECPPRYSLIFKAIVTPSHGCTEYIQSRCHVYSNDHEVSEVC